MTSRVFTENELISFPFLSNHPADGHALGKPLPQGSRNFVLRWSDDVRPVDLKGFDLAGGSVLGLAQLQPGPTSITSHVVFRPRCLTRMMSPILQYRFFMFFCWAFF